MTLIEMGALASALIALLTILSRVINLITLVHDILRQSKESQRSLEDLSRRFVTFKSQLDQVQYRLNRIDRILRYYYPQLEDGLKSKELDHAIG